jgi:hypothetical protein
MDQQIVAPAALVPLLGGALNAFEQAQLVLVLAGKFRSGMGSTGTSR